MGSLTHLQNQIKETSKCVVVEFRGNGQGNNYENNSLNDNCFNMPGIMYNSSTVATLHNK